MRQRVVPRCNETGLESRFLPEPSAILLGHLLNSVLLPGERKDTTLLAKVAHHIP